MRAAARFTDNLGGHYWTIAPRVWHGLRPQAPPPSLPWSTTLQDPDVGPVTLSGRLHEQPDSDACLVLVHGLGGDVDSRYMIDGAHAAARAGVACLRLNLRGSDRLGGDIYHAGLAADIEAALASPALQRFTRLFVLGFSIGGHVTLRHALHPTDARLRAVAALSPPLELALTAEALDRIEARVYLRNVLSGVKAIYAEVAQRRSVPTPVEVVRSVQSIVAWDGLTVVPRFGFRGVNDYYGSMSVGPRLAGLQVPALIVQSRLDPMVPPQTYAASLGSAPSSVTVRVVNRGGHVALPAGVDLSLGVPNGHGHGALDQVIGWLRNT